MAQAKAKGKPWRKAAINTERWLSYRSPGGRRSITSKPVREGILAALEKGPASVAELRERMGVAPPASTMAALMRVLERKGLVAPIMRLATKTRPATHPGAPIVWALVEKST